MESRQATLLGKNVQLLTYVTIFFLPLAFSTVRVYPRQLMYTHIYLRITVTMEHQRELPSTHPRVDRYSCGGLHLYRNIQPQLARRLSCKSVS